MNTSYPMSLCLAATLLIAGGCTPEPAHQQAAANDGYFKTSEAGVQTGGVKMIAVKTPSGDFNVWTKRIGNNPKVKLLLLHGGPGATHEYFECFESFLPAEGIEFIYYDQLGAGNSDHPGDTSLWDLGRFTEEVEQVRLALGLDRTNFFLLGHSWGGILAMEYALRYGSHLKGLVISNMMASAGEYDRYANEVLAPQMDPGVLDTIRKIEAAGDFANPKYMELLMPNYYAQHICRIPLDAWPEPMMRSFNKLNHQQYELMQGPSEFGIAGKLENWDVTGRLPEISTPTLVIGATYDTMDPKHMEWIAGQVKNGRFHLCADGSHMCMWDDQQAYMKGLISFLKHAN